MEINFIFLIAVLIISVMAHEIAHGAVAYYFGDPTAKNQGRLTLNPLKHIDMFGSIILPALLYYSTHGGFLFGWAKPVPYNPYNLRNRRLGEFCISIAGIITNFLIAIIFSFFIRFAMVWNLSQPVIDLLVYIIKLNITLGVFNLFPIPPLDGSKILFSLVPYQYESQLRNLEKYGMYILIILVVFFSWIIGDIVNWVFRLIV
ncbi:MAG: site-2 protease family protein [bacterium]